MRAMLDRYYTVSDLYHYLFLEDNPLKVSNRNGKGNNLQHMYALLQVFRLFAKFKKEKEDLLPVPPHVLFTLTKDSLRYDRFEATSNAGGD